ncbi:hypothetical protein IU440_10245 [Nocardia cyriacigeorgica]|uniref:hypothetical protein n=1 Tax=Nocardia cyriacigeorgica TaxID=135487 RepID=UPI001894E1CA|nr:hypothetical protein [Nocardia cyriacigeorgica]MBF6425061.1 hypothetical protein [Nocardia cyriacigeorgica]
MSARWMPTTEWFGPHGFATAVTVFSALFTILLAVDELCTPAIPWLILGGSLWATSLSIKATRQIGVGLLIASTAVPIKLAIYPIMAVLLIAGPFAVLCLIGGVVPYAMWRRRRKAGAITPPSPEQ